MIDLRILSVGIVTLLVAPAAIAQSNGASGSSDGEHCFNGYAYALESGEYRYTEHHEQQWQQGRVTSWSVEYVDADGRTIATKTMNFDASETVPTYTLEIPAADYMEGIRHDGDQWTMVRRQSADAEVQRKNFTLDAPIAGDSGFDLLVRDRFDALTDGETIPFKFVAAGRQAVVKLRASQTGTTTFEGEQAVVFTAELDMFLVNFFVDSLKLTYDPDTQRLLEYEGIGNMHNANGEVYPVRVTYASEMPQVAQQAGAPAADCGSVDG